MNENGGKRCVKPPQWLLAKCWTAKAKLRGRALTGLVLAVFLRKIRETLAPKMSAFHSEGMRKDRCLSLPSAKPSNVQMEINQAEQNLFGEICFGEFHQS